MENKKMIIANLKMNMTIGEISNYLNQINSHIQSDQVIICPTSIYIPYFLKQNYQVGLQNIFFRSIGAYTGEVSPYQAASMGIDYAIVGHNERRIYFDETDSDINKKILECLKYHVHVILCIGETIEEKNLLKTARILKRQVLNALRNVSIEDFSYITIAYEPVWSIGTDVLPTSKEIYDTIDYIKNVVYTNFEYENIPVVYGGSVNEHNIEELSEIENCAGFFVGRAACDPEKFLKIIEVAWNE